jgi:hypothetical protein
MPISPLVRRNRGLRTASERFRQARLAPLVFGSWLKGRR